MKQLNYMTLYYKTNTKMFRKTSLLLHKTPFLEKTKKIFLLPISQNNDLSNLQLVRYL